MTTLPASWLIPYTLNTFHREVPGGGACGCGIWADDLMECIVTTGLAGMIGALERAEAAGRPPPGGAVKRPALPAPHGTQVPAWPDSLGAEGYATSQPGNPGWLINRDANATPAAGGRSALVEARVGCPWDGGG